MAEVLLSNVTVDEFLSVLTERYQVELYPPRTQNAIFVRREFEERVFVTSIVDSEDIITRSTLAYVGRALHIPLSDFVRIALTHDPFPPPFTDDPPPPPLTDDPPPPSSIKG